MGSELEFGANRCGHWAQIEHAHEFNQLVDTFLSGNATKGVTAGAERDPAVKRGGVSYQINEFRPEVNDF